MNQAEIIAMAREVGLLPDNSHPTPETRAMRKRCEVVKRFAALVAAKEREACAQVCMDRRSLDTPWDCAVAIRARGTKEGA